jgi:hypothetical protein
LRQRKTSLLPASERSGAANEKLELVVFPVPEQVGRAVAGVIRAKQAEASLKRPE